MWQRLVAAIAFSSKSIGQSFSAFCASSLEYFSAVGSRHSLSEAVLSLALALLGLVCSEHLIFASFFRDS